MIKRSYTELVRHDSFEDRFRYLELKGSVGKQTFGYERFLNQNFYRSREWENVRMHVIARDYGMDLGVRGYEIHDKVFVHHMNPMNPDDLLHGNEEVLDPEFLITVSFETHNFIHYGKQNLTPRTPIVRTPNDHILW